MRAIGSHGEPSIEKASPLRHRLDLAEADDPKWSRFQNRACKVGLARDVANGGNAEPQRLLNTKTNRPRDAAGVIRGWRLLDHFDQPVCQRAVRLHLRQVA